MILLLLCLVIVILLSMMNIEHWHWHCNCTYTYLYFRLSVCQTLNLNWVTTESWVFRPLLICIEICYLQVSGNIFKCLTLIPERGRGTPGGPAGGCSSGWWWLHWHWGRSCDQMMRGESDVSRLLLLEKFTINNFQMLRKCVSVNLISLKISRYSVSW